MKISRLIVAGFIVTVVLAISAFAQTGKFGLIYTKAFENEKTGITKYINTIRSVDKEFEPATNQIKTLFAKFENLRKEIEALQQQAQSSTVPINPTTINAKADEYERLSREIKFKQEEAKASYERRQQEAMKPVLLDIGKAMDEFATQKGFTVILDSSKLEQAGVILVLAKTADLTEEFIKFYNARPVGTAAAKPK